MQEIARGIYIDNSYIGVTLGAINFPHGLVLIDAPPRPEDVRSWRSALLNLGGGIDRLLVNLDAHYDRTLGVRAMECTVVSHEKTAQVFRTRPTTFKPQNVDTGAEWELVNGLGSVRWAPPEITFSSRMTIHWGETPLILEYHPGPNPGALWVIDPEALVVFVGDAVMPGQPPFLANADLPAWIETLKLLNSPEYREYLIVGGRTGLVSVKEVRSQIAFLEKLTQALDQLAEEKAGTDNVEALIPSLARSFQSPAERGEQYTNRLRYGLSHYYSRHYHTANAEAEE